MFLSLNYYSCVTRTIIEFKYSNLKLYHCFGEQGSEPGYFYQPVDLAMNNTEDQLCYNHRVEVFTPQGQFLRVFKFLTNFYFTLHHPVGINMNTQWLSYEFINKCPSDVKTIDSLYIRWTLVNKFMTVTVCSCLKRMESLHQLLMVHVHKRKRFTHPHGVLVIDNGKIMIASGRLLVV